MLFRENTREPKWTVSDTLGGLESCGEACFLMLCNHDLLESGMSALLKGPSYDWDLDHNEYGRFDDKLGPSTRAGALSTRYRGALATWTDFSLACLFAIT